jgi:hypothetical protein
MNQKAVDRPAEPGHNKACHKQRKEKVKVAIHQAASAEDS